MMYLKPSEIYFSQAEINNCFDRRSDHAYKNLGDTLDELVEGQCRISDIPTISVIKRNGRWVTADNRRLWVFRHLEKLGKCATIPVIETYYIDSRKLNSTNGGRTVRFYSGRYPSGIWHSRVHSIDPEEPIQDPTYVSNLREFSSGSTIRSAPLHIQPVLSRMASLNLSNSDGAQELTTNDIRYTKESIVINNFFKNVKVSLSYSPHSQDGTEPVTVYKAFGKYWVTDGNKRLWCHKEASVNNIRAKVKDDKDEFLDIVRKERPWLSLIDILQSGEHIEVKHDN